VYCVPIVTNVSCLSIRDVPSVFSNVYNFQDKEKLYKDITASRS